MDAAHLCIVLAYAWLGVELAFFAVPSEASVLQIWRARDQDAAVRGDALATARRRGAAAKLLCYFVPTAAGVVLFGVPLAAMLEPRLLEVLGPIPWLRARAFLWTGVALLLAGRLLTFAAVLQLRRRGAGRALEARGLFELSRNPGLLGMFVFYLGACLVAPCVVLLAWFPCYVLNMHRRVRMEECHLLRALGERYRGYAARVPRYCLR